MNTNIELDVNALETAIDKLLRTLSEGECGSEHYVTMVDQLVKLYKAKETHIALKLKEIETNLKQNESEASIRTKETETQLKENEFLANIANKEAEIRVKETDLEIRKAESDTNCEVKKLDAQLKQRDVDQPWRVSPDTLAIVGANVLGIVMILGYERANVIASKALGLLTRMK
jgi:predicted RND superfamily exporter protein